MSQKETVMYHVSFYPPTNTFDDPDVIDPASALSSILPTAIPLINTVLDPALRLATCGTQGGAGGNGCDTVGAPTTIISIPFA
jgi:hypothetical protein